MNRKSLDDLGNLQRDVIEQVWELGEATVHQVRKQLSLKKNLAYTTVLTTMQKLEKAGWLRHRSDGKTYIYTPTRTREEAGEKSLQKFMDRMFDGNTLLMFQHLIRQNDLSDAELTELRKLIDEKRQERKKC
jgi:BlaI family transcriptional regulator, penicillinase repressor